MKLANLTPEHRQLVAAYKDRVQENVEMIKSAKSDLEDVVMMIAESLGCNEDEVHPLLKEMHNDYTP